MENKKFLRVEAVGRESIRCAQKSVKIMSPEVVSNKTENSNPYIRFYPVFLVPGPSSIRFTFVKDRDGEARDCGKETDSHVAPFVQRIVELEWNED